MADTHIYVLVDPRTDAVRYVGKTVQEPRARAYSHVSTAATGATWRDRWVLGLLVEGLVPRVVHIDTVTVGWAAAEREWIAFFRRIGAPLTNLTPGGDGGPQSPEHVAKRTAGLKGRVFSEATRAKMSASARARAERDPEYHRALGRMAKGRKLRLRTHCPHGHQYTMENTYVRPGTGFRGCRTCRSGQRARREEVATCP